MTGEGDVPEGCTLHIIVSSQGRMGFRDPLSTLRNMYPKATVKPWIAETQKADGGRKNTAQALAHVAHTALLNTVDGPCVEMTNAEWGQAAGVSKETVAYHRRQGRLAALLDELGIHIRVRDGVGHRLCRDPIKVSLDEV